MSSPNAPSPTTSIPSPPPSGQKRGKNWTGAEDEQLCKSWLAIAQDPIASNEEKSNVFWERVHSHFIGALPSGSERNQVSISNRWGQIQKAVNKFCRFFAQIEARNKSGETFEDKVRDAMALYKDVTGVTFTMFPLWTILRNARKWQDNVSNKERREEKRKEKRKVCTLT